MVLRNRNFSTRVVINENAPPASPKTKTSTPAAPTLQESTRRRRRRVSGSNLMRAAALAQQTQRRRQVIEGRTARTVAHNAPVVQSTPPQSSPSPSPTYFRAPRVLKRPPRNSAGIRQNLIIAGPEYEEVPYQYVLDTLNLLSSRMLSTLQTLRASKIPSGPFPTHVEFEMSEGGIIPSHVLAVHAPKQTMGVKTQVTLFPIHNQLLAAHCANIPPLPNLPVHTTKVDSRTIIRVPVVSCPLPHPEQFSTLVEYLYNKDTKALLATLLGCPLPPSIVSQLDPARLDMAIVSAKAKQLAKGFPAHVLNTKQIKVGMFWANAYALNVHDNMLWHTMQLAWRLLGDARLSVHTV